MVLGTNKRAFRNIMRTKLHISFFDRCLCRISLCKNKGRETFVQISPSGIVGESNKFCIHLTKQ